VTTAAPAPTAEVPVIVLATFRNSLCAAAGEHEPLRALSRRTLHEPDAAECLGEASGDLGVDLAALAEEGRSCLNAIVIIAPNAERATTVALVSFQFT